MLIGISGKMGTGKTELADVAEDFFGFKKASFGDEVKREVISYLTSNGISCWLKNFYGNSKDKAKHLTIPFDCMTNKMDQSFIDLTSDTNPLGHSISYRALLQWWGTEYRRKQNEDYWVEKLFDNYDNDTHTVIDDVRRVNEAEMIRVCGGLLIRVNWPGAANSSDHISETGLDTYPAFNLTITKPEDWTLDFCRSEYKSILANIIGVPNEETPVTGETASALLG